jgi:hypothetical protein
MLEKANTHMLYMNKLCSQKYWIEQEYVHKIMFNNRM